MARLLGTFCLLAAGISVTLILGLIPGMGIVNPSLEYPMAIGRLLIGLKLFFIK